MDLESISKKTFLDMEFDNYVNAFCKNGSTVSVSYQSFLFFKIIHRPKILMEKEEPIAEDKLRQEFFFVYSLFTYHMSNF